MNAQYNTSHLLRMGKCEIDAKTASGFRLPAS